MSTKRAGLKSILSPKRAKDVDMTQGSITRHIITFAFPLLIGNIFQQLYNTVDTWVVGNYVSNEAPAFLTKYSAYKLNKQGDNIQP